MQCFALHPLGFPLAPPVSPSLWLEPWDYQALKPLNILHLNICHSS